MKKGKLSEKPLALLEIDLERAFGSVWIDGLLFKLRKYNINGRMFSTLRTLLKTCQAYIELTDYKSPTFKMHIGVPQGSVLSPLLFIIYLNYFPDTEPCHFKFADDSAIFFLGSDTDDLVSKLRHSCLNIRNWCKQWRMGVNGSKPEQILMNVNESSFTAPTLNNELSVVKRKTESLGLTIDNKVNYKEHSERL